MSGTIEYCTRKWLHQHDANSREELAEKYHCAYDEFRSDLLGKAAIHGWT